MRLLILASRFPYPLEKGDKLRLFHQLRHLGEHFDVDLVCISERSVSKSDLEAVKPFCQSIKIYQLPLYKRIFGILNGLFRGWPASVSYFYNSRINDEISKIAINGNYDILYCQLIRMAPYAFSFPGYKVIDYMDAFALGIQKRAHSSSLFLKYFFKSEAERIREFEQLIYPVFDRHLIISDRDANSIGEYGLSQLEVVGNGVDASYFNYQSPLSRTPEYDIVFVGNLGYYPNVKAALFIIEEILPKLLKIRPDTKVLIAGARPSRSLTRLQNKCVAIWPWVEDVREAYYAGKIFVAPLFHGSGQQNKILEAMSLGIPCITTSYVNESIGAVPNTEILIAESAEEMTRQILSALEDSQLCDDLAMNARHFVESRYSWQTVNQKLVILLNESLSFN